MDSLFGFKPYDEELAENYSSVDSKTSSNSYQKMKKTKKLSCSICLETFKGSDSIVVLKCHFKHIFHIKCIEDWCFQEFKKNHRKVPELISDLTVKDFDNVRCPLCKEKMVNPQFLEKLKNSQPHR